MSAAQHLEELDATLALLEKTRAERSPHEQGRWKTLIDRALDERLAVMARL